MKLEGDTASKGDIVVVTKNLNELKTAQGERGTLLKNSGKTSLQQLQQLPVQSFVLIYLITSI